VFLSLLVSKIGVDLQVLDAFTYQIDIMPEGMQLTALVWIWSRKMLRRF
jgi:hypothetical protein